MNDVDKHQSAAAVRAAIRSVPGLFEVFGGIRQEWLAEFRLAHCRLLLSAIVDLVFDDELTRRALQESTRPDILIDDAADALPLGRWRSEVIFSASKGVVLEKDFTSVALILHMAEAHHLGAELLQKDLQQQTLSHSSETNLIKYALETRLYQEMYSRKKRSERFMEFSPDAMALSELGTHFWHDWYVGFVNGKPLDWKIQWDVALIPDADWKKGPEWIAGKIAEIEAEHQRTAKAQLPAEDVTAQSVRLLERPLLLETNAKGLQQLSQMAIDAYRREISNALPDCIEPLENIPGIAFEIACIAARDIQLSEKEALLAEQIQLMVGVIAELNGRLKRVPEPAPSGRKLFADAFYEKSGERVAELITSKMLWGGVAAGAGFIFGTPGDALIDTLSQCYNSVVAPEASPISNPSIIWHAPPKT